MPCFSQYMSHPNAIDGMLRLTDKIAYSHPQAFRIFREHSNCCIAPMAQQSTDDFSVMAVVNAEPLETAFPFRCFRQSAYCADSTLKLEESYVITRRHSKEPQQVLAPMPTRCIYTEGSHLFAVLSVNNLGEAIEKVLTFSMAVCILTQSRCAHALLNT